MPTYPETNDARFGSSAIPANNQLHIYGYMDLFTIRNILRL